jgi:hypothetical protein
MPGAATGRHDKTAFRHWRGMASAPLVCTQERAADRCIGVGIAATGHGHGDRIGEGRALHEMMERVLKSGEHPTHLMLEVLRFVTSGQGEPLTDELRALTVARMAFGGRAHFLGRAAGHTLAIAAAKAALAA